MIHKIKNKVRLLSQILSAVLLLLVIACEEDGNIVYGVDDEANAAVGFKQERIGEIAEGAVSSFVLEVGASKPIFSDISFDLVPVSGDASELSITDANGNSGPNFTVPTGSSSISLNVKVIDNSVYSGDRSVEFKLDNLVGDRVFLADTTYSTRGRSIHKDFKFNITDDEPIPPLVSFDNAESSVDENAGSHNILITFSEAIPTAESFDIIFTGSAIEGTNYNAGTTGGALTVNVNPGATQVTVPITIIDDALIESDKTIVMNLSNYSAGLFRGGVTKHNVTIVEDDIPTEVLEIVSEADVHIKGGTNGDDNFSTGRLDLSNKLPDERNTRSGLMRFDISGINASKVMDAQLVLTTYRETSWSAAEIEVGGPTTQTIHYVSDDSWDQNTVTWNTTADFSNTTTGRFDNPAIVTFTAGAPVATSGLTGIKHSYDVTSQLQITESDGKLSLGIEVVSSTGGARIFYFCPRGADVPDPNNAPKLVITVRTD